MLGRILFITSRYGALPQGMVNSLDRMGTEYLQVPIWNLEEAYEQYRPQNVIFFHHFLKEFDKTMLDRLEKITCHKGLWSWEEPWEIDYLREWHHPFSYVLIQDKNSANVLNDYSNSQKFIHVPHAADRDLALPIDIPFEYRSDLCFIGAAYPSRLKFMREILPQLKDYKVVIGGTGWEFLPDTTGQKIINSGVGEDYIKYYRGAKVALNLHRLSDEMPIANTGMVKASSPNNRFFELNMMGCAQIVDNTRMPELSEYYPVNMVCENVEEFVAQIKEWVNDDENRKRYAKQMQEYSLEHNSYENRFTEIIAKII